MTLTWTSLSPVLPTSDSRRRLCNRRAPPCAVGQTVVHVEAGTGSLAIHIPTGVAARINAYTIQASLEVDVIRFPVMEEPGAYCSRDYEGATNRADIDVKMGVGTISIT